MKRVGPTKVNWVRSLHTHTTQRIHSFTFVYKDLSSSRSLQTKCGSTVKGIYALTNENSTVEIYTKVAYFLSSHTEESESCTSGVVDVGTVNANAMMDDDGWRRWRRHVPLM
jgi:hypothetical protein